MTKDSGRSSTYKIYVGNLGPTTTNHDLVRVFSSYGSVIEAVALANKGFGFVHMASEEDGVRAMKSLYKYILNGKEMVVQPAINPKKASVTPYSSFKRATIGGRGVTNLDDFEDYCQADSYLDQEIANCIQADSSPTSDHSSLNAATYYGYCSTASSPSNSNATIPKLSSINTLDASRSRDLVVVSSNSQGSCSSVRSNGDPNSDLCGNDLSSLLAASKGAHNNSGLPSIWDGTASSNTGSDSTGLNLNSLLQSSGVQSFNNTHSNLSSSLNGVNQSLVDQLLSSNNNNNNSSSNKLNPLSKLNPTAIGSSETNGQLSNILASYSSQIHQLRVALAQNPNNPQIVATLTKLHQEERALTQSSLNSDQIKSDQHIHNSILKLKQEQLQEQELQRLLMQQQLQKQRQEQQQQQQQQQQLLLMNSSGLNGNNCIGSQPLNSTPLLSSMTNGLSSSIASSLALSGTKTSLSMNTATNTSAPTKPSFINGNNGHSNGFSNNNSHHFMNSPTSNTSVIGNSAVMPPAPPLCGLCNEGYDSGPRVPKILGCTHTFCLRCLYTATTPTSSEVRCLGGCGLATHLSDAGVSGLTTNQAALSATLQYNAKCNRAIEPTPNSMLQSAQQQEVCAACTGTRQDQPLEKCREEGHTLVLATDAVRVIRMQLKPLVESTLSTLREAMKLRAGIKERVESTLQALAKFIDELQAKLSRDNVEEQLLISTLNDLNCVHQQMDTHTYSDLVRTYHMVEKCSKDINLQYNQCLTATCINTAVKEMSLTIHPQSLPAINKLGVKQDERFAMEQSLRDHALSGNYANVLLQYMVADLLASRLSHNALLSKDTLALMDSNQSSANYSDNGDNLSSQLDSHSVCSASPAMGTGSDIPSGVIGGDGAYASLTVSSAATPDMTAMNNGGHGNLDSLAGHLDHMDINCVIQTTEAIEAENGATSKSEMTQFSDSTSLGLSNICHMVTDDETLETIDLEKSLLEGSACIEPETTAVQSSAPSPSSSNSITPPIVSSANRSSVDSSAASSDSGISSCKPFSYLDAAKKPAKPQPEAPPKTEVVKMPPQLKQIKTPHCWMKVTVDGKSIGRIVFQLRPDKAPKMCENFLGLCTGKPGYGYQGTHFFKNGDGFLAGGDVEFDDGSGGYSIYGQKKFEADLCPLKDEVGMIRFKGNGTSDSGRGMVGSQFMVWYAEREFKKFSYSLVFGRVVDGLDVVKKAANVNLGKHDVMIEECGGIM